MVPSVLKSVRKPFLTGKIELYDLSADVGERNNLAAKHPDLVKKMIAAMKDAHIPSPRWKVRRKRR